MPLDDNRTTTTATIIHFFRITKPEYEVSLSGQRLSLPNCSRGNQNKESRTEISKSGRRETEERGREDSKKRKWRKRGRGREEWGENSSVEIHFLDVVCYQKP